MSIPKISVIVPIYNVQQYLEECLDSLAKQTFQDIEIIMVNDGSTDNSGEIMHQYANTYNNFFAYDKPNGGLGQARNYGVPFARGEYITFVDSDDIVQYQAYEKMYNSACQTNSDLVIGNVVRFNSEKQSPSVLHQKVFSKTKLKAHITRDFELVYDTTAWNKLYRKSFWLENHLEFPEGMLYEDIPVTFPAHYFANSVDVLDDVVYYWRTRDLGDQSITQNRTEIKNLTDRIKAVRMLNQFFEANNIEGELKETKDFKILNVDLLVYLNVLPEADEFYIHTYLDEVSKYLQSVSDTSINKLHPINRMKYHFVKLQDKETLLDLLKFQKSGEFKKSKIIKKNNHYYVDYPYKEQVPESYLIVDDNLQIKRKTLNAKWNGQKLNVKGYAFISQIDVGQKSDVSIHFELGNEETGEMIPIHNFELTKRTNNTYKFGIKDKKKFQTLKRIYNYDWSGFKLSIDFNQAPYNNLPIGDYYIQGVLTSGGLTRTFRVGSPIKGKAPRPRYTTYEDIVLYGKYNAAWDFTIYKNQIETRFEEIEVKDQFLRLTGFTELFNENSQLLISNQSKGIKKTFTLNYDTEPQKFNCEIPLTSFKYDDDTFEGWWSISILQNEIEHPIILPVKKKFTIDTGYAELLVKSSFNGNLMFQVQEYGAHLLDLNISNRDVQLKIEPPIHWDDNVSKSGDVRLLVLSNDRSEIHYFPASYISNVNETPFFEAHINLDEDFNEDVFVQDNFYFKLILGDWAGTLDNTLRIYTDKVKKVKKEKASISFDEKLYKFRFKNTLSILIKPKWGWIDRGPFRREILRKYFYPLARLLPLKKKTIIFESYWGKNYECNSRALYEYIINNYPEYETVWSLRNPLTRIEGPGKKIRMHSLKYYYYMARAKYFVNNVNFPDFYRKRKNAVELQTMHGTPLKTLGLDVPGEIKPGKKMEKYLEKNRRWDYLSVPSDYVADIAERAFSHNAKVLNSGYPRNDKLIEENTPEKILEIKKKLGIPLDKKVIFYAPTWRVKNRFKMEIDIKQWKEKLNDDYILLVKFHHYVAAAVKFNGEETANFLYNQTSYDDIRDLYLIADVLITDYSSVMFDYALLNRPIILFTYDLEQYRDSLRGMYFDIIEKAPGPICLTNDELLDELVHLDKFHLKYGDKLKSFREAFNQYDKGNASEQIFNVMFKK
jgi:CDP-glycerol glycerophosphotransferase